MTVKFYRDGSNPAIVYTGDDEVIVFPPGVVEITEAEFDTQLADNEAAIESSIQGEIDAADSDALARAQSVYDEIVSIHPISALETAKLIHPNFENDGVLVP